VGSSIRVYAVTDFFGAVYAAVMYNVLQLAGQLQKLPHVAGI